MSVAASKATPGTSFQALAIFLRARSAVPDSVPKMAPTRTVALHIVFCWSESNEAAVFAAGTLNWQW